MSLKTLSWILVAVITLGAVLLFNYWASYQLLSTLAYAGIVAALIGLANLAIPFRFLGIRRRVTGALVLAAGLTLIVASLFWPASTFRVAQHKTVLDDVMPEYQFWERHSLRMHARPEQVLQAVRESTFADMKSLATLLKVRAAALRIHDAGDSLRAKKVFDAFSVSGYASGGSDHEVVMCGGANVREKRVLTPHTLQECADYHQPGAVKMAFNFSVEEAAAGWCTVTTETRVLALDEATRRGMGRYWRLIVPGSGLLRRQWLAAIKQKAETAP